MAPEHCPVDQIAKCLFPLQLSGTEPDLAAQPWGWVVKRHNALAGCRLNRTDPALSASCGCRCPGPFTALPSFEARGDGAPHCLESQDVLSSSQVGFTASPFHATVGFPSHTWIWGALEQPPHPHPSLQRFLTALAAAAATCTSCNAALCSTVPAYSCRLLSYLGCCVVPES